MTRPDSPCIAVCTTYDEICKGCGRHFLEVAQWHSMPEAAREAVWQRIENEATAWQKSLNPPQPSRKRTANHAP